MREIFRRIRLAFRVLFFGGYLQKAPERVLGTSTPGRITLDPEHAERQILEDPTEG